jgi:hypothetical protein
VVLVIRVMSRPTAVSAIIALSGELVVTGGPPGARPPSAPSPRAARRQGARKWSPLPFRLLHVVLPPTARVNFVDNWYSLRS